ncbi:unnamed protein product [Arabis nemorensis]|uniref:Uncharacterized protein n=1 Tax=Arabis nemorensis TaxID=586526 RepID=A0A565AMG0_9BRAS|nr:unnamed protein product [Arabis nemorensis]
MTKNGWTESSGKMKKLKTGCSISIRLPHRHATLRLARQLISRVTTVCLRA